MGAGEEGGLLLLSALVSLRAFLKGFSRFIFFIFGFLLLVWGVCVYLRRAGGGLTYIARTGGASDRQRGQRVCNDADDMVFIHPREVMCVL